MTTSTPASRLSHLECAGCGRSRPSTSSGSCPDCGGRLLCRYSSGDSEAAPGTGGGPRAGLFRWASLLPVLEPARRLDLGAGDTPLLDLPRRARELGLSQLLLKDDGAGPLGTGALRAACVAVAAHAERGARSVTVASPGPSGTATAAAARRHGLECRVAIPSAATPHFRLEARLLGARVVAVLGDAGEADAWVESHSGGEGDRVLSELSEPHGLEGQKTLGLEIWEQLEGRLPDAVVVPTGTGLQLLALEKAFDDLRRVGAWDGASPRPVAAQVDGCAPIVRAFAGEDEDVEPWTRSRRTLAESLRVPRPRGAKDVLALLRANGGLATAVSEHALVEAARATARADGVIAGAEGAAALAALESVRATGELEGARVLVVSPTSARRTPELLEAAGAR